MHVQDMRDFDRDLDRGRVEFVRVVGGSVGRSVDLRVGD